MENLPWFVSVLLLLSVLCVLLGLYSAHKSGKFMAFLLLILVVQSVLAWRGFYLETQTMPPRVVFVLGVPLFFIFLLLLKAGAWLRTWNAGVLTLMHSLRVPVELMLYFLYVHKMVPELMTFEGRNWDILSGLSAPLIYYFGYVKKRIGRKVLIVWNLICMGLLFNIVIHAVLAIPTPFQMHAFDQPNIGVLYFPYILLPAIIVPAVLLAHLVCLVQLLGNPQAGFTTRTGSKSSES